MEKLITDNEWVAGLIHENIVLGTCYTNTGKKIKYTSFLMDYVWGTKDFNPNEIMINFTYLNQEAKRFENWGSCSLQYLYSKFGVKHTRKGFKKAFEREIKEYLKFQKEEEKEDLLEQVEDMLEELEEMLIELKEDF